MSQPDPSTPTNPELQSGGTGKGLKIAVIVLAITTIAFLIWGIVTTVNLNKEKDANASEVTSVDEAQATINKLAKEYGLEKRDFAKEQQTLTALRQQYDEAQKSASEAKSTAQAQLAAAQAQARLAQTCAAVLANGMVAIYQDVPGGVTVAQVSQEMLAATAPCKGVVKITVP